MLTIGLTGGIGSGKSTAARIFELLGVPVYYADAASKKLYQTNQFLRASLVKLFGEDIYAGNELNRQKLADIVFADKDKLQLLNQLVHPLTIQDANDWIKKQNADYVIKEAALLFESGSYAALDYIIGVYAPASLRIERVMERDGITKEHVLKRMDKQMNEEEKMSRCDFVLKNDETELLIPQVIALHQKLIHLSPAGRRPTE
jgi:dephospho-CoA kinase